VTSSLLLSVVSVMLCCCKLELSFHGFSWIEAKAYFSIGSLTGIMIHHYLGLPTTGRSIQIRLESRKSSQRNETRYARNISAFEYPGPCVEQYTLPYLIRQRRKVTKRVE